MAMWLLPLEFLDLICNLGPMVAGWLDRVLRVANLLQHDAIFLEILSEGILLLADLSHQDSHLVGDIGDGIVVSPFTPFGQLGRNGHALATGLLMGTNGSILVLDDLVQLLAQLGLLKAAQRGEAEPGTSSQ